MIINIPYPAKKNAPMGFTLIEVLVALVILAIALTAVIKATNEDIYNTQTIIERTLSEWVGLNIIADIRTGLLPLPSTDTPSTGKTEMRNRFWYWTATAKPSHSPNILEITVNVSNTPSSEKILAHLIDYLRLKNNPGAS